MKKLSLSDTTCLENLFSLARSWENSPAGELSAQQIALISLKNSAENLGQFNLKAGGRDVMSSSDGCFICATGA